MTARAPGFIDETTGKLPEQPAAGANEMPAPRSEAEPAPEMTQQRPVLLDPEPGAAAVIETGWLPAPIGAVSGPMGSLSIATIGFAVLAATWLVVSVGSFVAQQFQVSSGLGWLVLLAEAAGLGLVCFAGWREWSSIRRLRNAEHLRSDLQSVADFERTRAHARAWLAHVGSRVDDPQTVDLALKQATSIAELRAILRNRVAEDLEKAAKRVGATVAQQGAALVALNPHSGWDGVAVGLCGLRVIRQVAVIYGLRPGPIVTLTLLRLIGRMAMETTATDIAAQALSEQMVDVPYLKLLIKALPGSGVAAMRLYRLAVAAAHACSPVSV